MINKEIFDFLSELKKNNNKEWFDLNRKRYQALRKDFVDFISLMILELANMDSDIQYLEAKNCIFRINRDIRFSNDKSPYKSNMGAAISPGGRKSMMAGYYLHLQPGASFIAGGMHMPPSAELKSIRTEIYDNPKEFLKIINKPNFIKYFKQIEGEKLKSAPRGFPKDDKNIDLLKYKSYTLIHPLKDEVFFQKNLPQKLMEVFSAMKEFNLYLRKTL